MRAELTNREYGFGIQRSTGMMDLEKPSNRRRASWLQISLSNKTSGPQYVSSISETLVLLGPPLNYAWLVFLSGAAQGKEIAHGTWLDQLGLGESEVGIRHRWEYVEAVLS
ncbi:hypothetical protein E2562_009882 [Oryza meyeriana var. granulata]|nr:hypothetical protein E2562_009882 [Oryza meyeriana var. granulata]KAF0891462.1 hypothetical protein E2562_009882 [Oryza meyeriana var. granulata]KAF0891464.1 hypothetical protein E2562_009882 [Oryza meyeriana var. granulata]KAF0891465.1 hypothetical protein E2562_009882 [Oryza meyeriana var. granulata]